MGTATGRRPRTPRRGQPRADPRAGCAGEQPEGRQRRDAEAPADRVHRRLRVGQELAGVRHHRRRVAAADQRDLQRVRAGLHAEPGPAGGRPARRPDHGDHRRPGAHGRQPALHGGHRHRRQRDAAHPVQPARAALRRAAHRLRVQRAHAQGERRHEHREGRPGREERGARGRLPGRHVPALRGHGLAQRLRPHRHVRRVEVPERGRPDGPRLQHGRVVRPALPGASASTWTSRSGSTRRRRCPTSSTRSRPRSRSRGSTSPTRASSRGSRSRCCPRTSTRCSRTSARFVERAVTFTTCPDCDGTRLSAEARSSRIGGKNIAEVCAMQITDLAEWVRGLDEPSVAPLLAGLQHLLDSFAEIGLGYLSLDRPAGTLSGGEAQRTKMIRHLGSSLTDVTYVFDEPTIGLHPHDIERMNRSAAPAARQGQHRAGRRAQAGDHRDRRPRRRPRARRRHRRRRGRVRGHRRGAAGQRHDHRPAPRRPGPAEGVGADAVGGARGARRQHAQPAGRRRRHPARGARGAHRGGRIGEELADPGLDRRARRRGGGRPGGDPRLAAEQPGDLHRPARPDPQGLREGQRGEAGAVQRQLRGRLPGLQRRRRHLHRAGRHGHRGVHLRGVRGPALPGRGARVHARRPRTSPRCSRCRWPRRRSSSATARRAPPPRTRSSTGSPTSGSAT